MENHSEATNHISNLAGDLLELIKLVREGNKLDKGGKEAWTEEKKNDNDAENGDGKEKGQKDMSEKSIVEKELEEIQQGKKIQAYFPVYGTVSAGKSTFLSTIMGVNLLPQSNAAATSIPTSIYHSGSSDGKKYTLPQCEKWNDAIDDFKNRLLAGNLDTEVTAEDGGELLYNLQEAIRNGKVKLLPTCSEDDEMAEQLWIISNFTRLVWKNNLDLEDDYDISIALDKLPRLDAPMPTFAGFPPNSFAFLDTPGPNEAKAHEALNKLTPKIIRPASGVILCMPPDQIDTLTTGKLFLLINEFMREKTIIVIMTKCDTIDENEFNELAVKVKEKLSPDVRPNATVIMSKTIHIRAMLKLREYLSTRKTKEDLNFEQLKQLPVWKDIETAYPQKASTNTEQQFSWPNLMSRGKLEDLYEDMVNLCHSELRNMKADDLLNTFRNLYSNAKVIALKGSLGTIIGHFADFKTNLDELEKFANASVAERKKIQQ
jgi:GTPase SAR1 family protein